MEIELKKLGEITTGNTPSKKDESYWDSEDICFVKPDGIAEEGITIINDSSEYISENARSKARVASKDAVFVTCIGSIGKIGIADAGDYAFNQQINVIEPNERVLPRYLAYNLLYSKPRLEAIANAPVVPIINKTQFEDFILSIDEDKTKQAEIVSVLDKLVGIIESRKRELESFDELIKARFVELFGDLNVNPKGWELKSFDELTNLITDGEHSTPRRCEEGVYLLSARNVLNHELQLEDVDYIDDEEYERISKRIIPESGDVLLSCSGTVGRCCCVPEGLKFQMVRSTALLRFKEELNPVFAEYMITSDFVQKQIDKAKTASSQANLFQGKIAKLRGFVPPRELQDEFLVFAKQVDKSKVAVQKALDESQLLFDSLMQEYFG